MEAIDRRTARRVDFTPDEWWMMRKAMFGSAVSVALAGRTNGHWIRAMFAVTQQLLAARSSNTSQLVRELADFSRFETGVRAGMSVAEKDACVTSGLNAIRSAVATVVAKAPADAMAFQEFLLDLAATPARTHTWVSDAEVRAIAQVKEAVGMSSACHGNEAEWPGVLPEPAVAAAMDRG